MIAVCQNYTKTWYTANVICIKIYKWILVYCQDTFDTVLGAPVLPVNASIIW